MKKIIYILFATLVVASCSDLNLSPKDEAASGNWYQTDEQFEMSLNALLSHYYWPRERHEFNTSGNTVELDMLSDDMTNRQSVNTFMSDGLNSTNTTCLRLWDNTYTAINRANKLISEAKKHKNDLEEDRYNMILGCGLFYRACFYGRIMQYFGDPVIMDENLDVETEEGREAAYLIARTSMWEVLPQLLDDLEQAAELLPVSYAPGEVERATKGAAYGMKARLALFFASIRKFDTSGLGNINEANNLYDIARKAAKACMDLGVYQLYPDFRELFLQSTKHTSEGIFVIPRSKTLSNSGRFGYLSGQSVTAKLPRNSGAPTCTTCCPSWDLLCAFYDDEGKPIDESTVFDPREPFKHRDPRCAATIVEFGTEWLGVIYEPHFLADSVMSTRYGGKILNKDSRSYLVKTNENEYASYNGLVFKKHIDDSWLSPFEVENEKKILRYADVLLMYAEACIELNQIDNSTLDAMNMVRARAYKADYTNTSAYPAITETNQAKLRSILRSERRMELCFEGLRYLDVIRWRAAEVPFNQIQYGLPKKDQTTQTAYLDKDYWFMGAIPQIDENGCPDFRLPPASGASDFFTKYAVKLSQRKWNANNRQYFLPIPQSTLNVMPNVTQNPGY